MSEEFIENSKIKWSDIVIKNTYVSNFLLKSMNLKI